MVPGDPVITGSTIVTAGDIASFTCQSNGGKPAATLTFFLNDVNLDVYSTVSSQLDGSNAFLVTNVLVYMPTSADNGGMLRCDVTHTTLATEKTTDVTLTVRCK